MKINKLIIDQLDQKLLKINQLKNIDLPSLGWIRTIRKALGMSLEQLGKKMNTSQQNVMEMEVREKGKTITLKTLETAASALNMKLVYVFIPLDETLEKLIDRKAEELATKIVLKTAHNMKLEDQANSSTRIKKAIKERASSIINERPKLLWD